MIENDLGLVVVFIRGGLSLVLAMGGILALYFGYKLIVAGKGDAKDDILVEIKGFKATSKSIGSFVMITASFWGFLCAQTVPSFRGENIQITQQIEALKDELIQNQVIFSTEQIENLKKELMQREVLVKASVDSGAITEALLSVRENDLEQMTDLFKELEDRLSQVSVKAAFDPEPIREAFSSIQKESSEQLTEQIDKLKNVIQMEFAKESLHSVVGLETSPSLREKDLELLAKLFSSIQKKNSEIISNQIEDLIEIVNRIESGQKNLSVSINPQEFTKFFLDKTSVTEEQFKLFVNDGGRLNYSNNGWIPSSSYARLSYERFRNPLGEPYIIVTGPTSAIIIFPATSGTGMIEYSNKKE